MATDEYFTGITRYIPAQTSDIFHLVHQDDVKSPLQILPLHIFAQSALRLGITEPYWQYRFSMSALAIINTLILAFVFRNYFVGKERGNILFLMFGCFFIAPFAFTRPMFESLAAPWIALTALFGSRYDKGENTKDLILSVVFISIAFVMRQQVGICALAIIILTLAKKKWGHFYLASLVGLALFIISGIPDYFLRGSFHHSLISILKYNVQFGSEYAQHPVYTYPLLIFALCFGPWWIKSYPAGFWANHFKSFRLEWLMLGLFVLLHSCFPQKWERFLISMVPLLMILMTPLIENLLHEYRVRKWRAFSLLAINLLLFIPASFFPPQKNLISLSLYINRHPEITVINRVDNIPEWITDAFIKDLHYQFKDFTKLELPTIQPVGCNEILVVSEFMAHEVDKQYWEYDTTMNVNLIEALSYRLNPSKNVRRAPLAIFKAKNCD